MKILALDTATENCGAALWLDGAVQVREQETPREHANLILGLIDDLLADAGLSLARLDAIAFGCGPGSFTGVRLAAAITQGLAFAADRPVLPISNLRALAQQAFVAHPESLAAWCCLDARMGEVYAAAYVRKSRDEPAPVAPAVAEAVLAPQAVTWEPSVGGGVVAVGRGFRAYESLRALAAGANAVLMEKALPSARDIAVLGAADWVAGLGRPATDAQPVYLRNNVVTPP